MKTFLLGFYHDCIIPVPHDSDADFGFELHVNSVSFHLYSCIIVWKFDPGKEKTLT